MERTEKKIIIFAILAITVFLSSRFAAGEYFCRDLEVVFFDVGQGDAVLIKTPAGQNILIDGGPDNSLVYALGRNLPFYDFQIDTVILTHPHDDHLMAFPEIFRRLKVKQVIYTGAMESTFNYQEFLAAIQAQNIPTRIIDRSEEIIIEERKDAVPLKLNFLWPEESFNHKKMADIATAKRNCGFLI